MRSLLSFAPHVYALSRSENFPKLPIDTLSLDDILRIVAKAKETHDVSQDEAGWNNLVHTPILEAALYGRLPWGQQLVGFCPWYVPSLA